MLISQNFKSDAILKKNRESHENIARETDKNLPVFEIRKCCRLKKTKHKS